MKLWACFLFAIGLLVVSVSRSHLSSAADDPAAWEEILRERLASFGHRNWIVIADSAYPEQSSSGIETIVTHGDQLEVVRAVLERVTRSKHVRPSIYLDAELPHVSDRDAPGITRYQDRLNRLLADRKVQSLPHEQIIDKLDKAGAKFKILVLKTNFTLPYTSVFVELQCGYWSDEAEQRLRKALQSSAKPN